MRLLVSGRADFLGELVDLGHNVGNLAKGRVEFLTEAQAIVHDAGAALHVFDCLARFFLNALDKFGDFLCRLR